MVPLGSSDILKGGVAVAASFSRKEMSTSASQSKVPARTVMLRPTQGGFECEFEFDVIYAHTNTHKRTHTHTCMHEYENV